MTRFGHLASIQSLIRFALSLALIGAVFAPAVLAADGRSHMRTALRVGIAGKDTARGKRIGLALGLTIESTILPNTIGGVNIDYLSLNAGGASSRLVSATYVIKADLGGRERLLHWRPGIGLGVGFAGGTNWCARASIELAWINPQKRSNFLIDLGVAAWGGTPAAASPLPFVRIGLLTRNAP